MQAQVSFTKLNENKEKESRGRKMEGMLKHFPSQQQKHNSRTRTRRILQSDIVGGLFGHQLFRLSF
jgi:hypothetical protein